MLDVNGFLIVIYLKSRKSGTNQQMLDAKIRNKNTKEVYAAQHWIKFPFKWKSLHIYAIIVLKTQLYLDLRKRIKIRDKNCQIFMFCVQSNHDTFFASTFIFRTHRHRNTVWTCWIYWKLTIRRRHDVKLVKDKVWLVILKHESYKKFISSIRHGVGLTRT